MIAKWMKEQIRINIDYSLRQKYEPDEGSFFIKLC